MLADRKQRDKGISIKKTKKNLKNNQLNISVLMNADIQTTTGRLAIAPKKQYCSRGGTSKIRQTSSTYIYNLFSYTSN